MQGGDAAARPDPANAGGSPAGRPKLVFFQWDHRPNAGAATFLLQHMEEHVKCLSRYFDVTVVNADCDYAEVCDRVEPDLALFEAGYRTHGSKRIDVRNTTANPGVPKLGLHNADAWCDRRSGFLSDMDHWGIETFFSICTTAAEYTPTIADRLFVWPNFIDADVFRDYGQAKTVPVMLTGQAYGLYPWRQRVYPRLSASYPCLVSPQFAYEARAAARMLHGERYARALNASFVVPTCGTMAREVVRKHFEIPGAMSCLVTERSPALEAAGFVDLENCVFADESDVIDRLDWLFANPDAMQRITEAGHALVHARHTLDHRPQILQWLQLHHSLRPGQRIAQPGPFADLIATDRPAPAAGAVGAGLDRPLLRQAERALQRGEVTEARRRFTACLDYVSYLPEARLGLALCALQEGDAAAATALLAGLIETTTVDYGAADPDPVEWACFLIALACQGRVQEALELCDWYPGLAHRELDHARLGLQRLAGRSLPSVAPAPARRSIHRLADRDYATWSTWCASLLAACGQRELAHRLTAPDASARTGRAPRSGVRWYRQLDRALRGARLRRLRPHVPPAPEFHYLRRLGRQAGRLALQHPLGAPVAWLRDVLRSRAAAGTIPAPRKPRAAS